MRLSSSCVVFLLSGCAAMPSVASTSSIPAPVAARHFEGHVRYEARHETPRGASQALEVRPARFVLVEALAQDGTAFRATRTDQAGAFALDAPETTVRLRISADVEAVGTRVTVSPDARGRGAHSFEVPVAQAAMDIVASENTPRGDGGAFHLVDTMLLGAERLNALTQRTLPPVFAYWGRGVTSDWSYYHGEQPRGSGRYGLELLGGERDRQASSDTDEHDEAIVLHEFGHFVFDMLSTDSSPGGTHPVGVLVEPGLAWEEGRASFFAGAILRSPLYRDTIGLEPRGEYRVNIDMEQRGTAPRGVGSEGEVEEILWDLADGADLPDADQDGVALGAARVLELMFAMREVPGAYPSLSTFLTYVVDQGAITRQEMTAFLDKGGHPRALLAAAGEATWPPDIALPGTSTGKIDAVSNPSPSGGAPRASNGVDAVRVFRVHVTEPGYLEVMLRIEGPGTAASRTDLDLELRDIRADLLATSAGEGATELVARHVDPGYYVIVVRDGGGEGSRAGFELKTRFSR